MENISNLKNEILKLTSSYSKKAHSAFRPDGDELRSVWVKGMPIPYAGRVFTEEEVVQQYHQLLILVNRIRRKWHGRGIIEIFRCKKCLLVNSSSSANLVAISALTFIN